MTIDDDISALVGFICEASLYGCYTSLFALAVYLNPDGPYRWPRVKRPIFILSVFMYLFCSTHFALQFNHFYTALNTKGVKGFANLTSTVIAAGIDMTLADFTGQLIFTYRCWVLWSKNYWVVVVPILGAISGTVSIAEVAHLVIHTHETSSTLPASVVRWNSVVFIVKVIANAMVTVLIVVRMWNLSPPKRADILGANLPTGTGWAVIVIVIESGALYLAAEIVPLILYTIRHPALGLVSSVSVQIYGIASILVFIRMTYLLNPPPEQNCRGAPATPRLPVSNKSSSGQRKTKSKGPGLINGKMSMSDIKWKSGSEGLGPNQSSNFDSVENVTAV